MRVSQRVGDRRGREWAIGSDASDQPAPSAWWIDTATLKTATEAGGRGAVLRLLVVAGAVAAAAAVKAAQVAERLCAPVMGRRI